MKVQFVHFPLHPDTPPEGKSLEALFAGRGYDIDKMQAQMRARMTAEGLPYGNRTMTYNSRLAQELGKWADSQPGGEAIHDALFRAYFVDVKNIGDPGTSGFHCGIGSAWILVRPARSSKSAPTRTRSTPTGRSRGATA